MEKLDELERLQRLRESGAITADEFEKVKNKILADDVEAVDNKQIKEDVVAHKETVTAKVKEHYNVENITNNKICNKCGNELLEEDKFCGKCGSKVKLSIKRKIKILIIISIIVIILIIGTLSGLYFYGENIKIGKITINNPMSNYGITDEYLTNNFKENGWDQYDNVDVNILAIADIEYNEFNKVVLASNTVTNNGVKLTNTGILLLNRKDNMVKGFTINSNLIMIFNGLANNSNNKAIEVLEVSVKYIQEYGIDFFSNNSSNQYRLLIKEISDIIGVNKARGYVKSGMVESVKSISSNLDYTLLFEKESALVKYIAFYGETLEFNSSWPIDETAAKYLYTYNRRTYNNLISIYGQPYKTVKQYELYSMEDVNAVSTYKSLETAKEKLNVEE